MANEENFHTDEKAIQKQAEAANEANAGYGVSGPVAAAPLPQLPDLGELKLQQGEQQGGARPIPEGVYEDVKIEDDGTRVGKGSTPARKVAEKAAAGSGSSSS